jgi:hypothetical protein
VHKANLGSQLSIFDTGSSARARPRPNDPPERVPAGDLKRPARTTETKRQGRAGQTSCTSVHKANLGSQLSIFDTGSSARARPRPNDPPERVQPGARKRPARTTETKRQGRAGQTSCTSVHKANLGSQLSIFDTGSSARARPRPNDPPERVHAGALKRPARTTETKRQGRAGQTSCTSVHKANLGSQLSIFDTGSSARARPRPNDPPERVQPGALKRPARTTETKRQGRAGQTSCTSVHKANLGSQLSIFDTGSSARARPRPNDPPERVQPGALKRPARTTETKRQGRAGQTSCTSVHKANLGSQLSIFDTGSSARARPRPNDPPERVHPGALKRPARTTETKRQGRAGQTSCTSVHKANLGSQLSIFDTGSSARARPRPNDPPERVHPGALKRPARTTETKRQGRAGQTSCTSVHKANLGSQLSIFDTGSSARARPRPNDPPERVHPGALKRPARTTETKRQGRAGQTSCTSVHKANLGSQLSIFDTGSSARARPRPNDPPERVHPGALKRPARTTETKRQGRAGQTSCTSVHKANLGSQLSIFDTGSSARARPRPNGPPERVHPGALKRPARTTETKRQGRAGQTSCTSVHKANLGSQLSIFDTGSSARARPRPNGPPERVHPGALKRPARTTETKRQGRAGQTSCTSVHKANLGSQLSIFDTGSSARARPRPNDPPERVHPGALKRPARTTETKRQGRAGQTSCTSVHKANLGSQLSIFDTGSSARARPRPNGPPERVHPGALKRPARTTETKRQGRAGQTSCTSVHKANLGSQLSIFDTGSSARARPRPNDPPERVQPGALKRPARTTETKRQGRAGQTSCTSVHKANLGSQLSIFDTGSSARARPRPNDPPERVQPGALKRPARTTETKRQGRAGQTSCTSVHKANLGSQLSIFDTGSSARARPRPNDPPERVHPGALKRPARTTETKRQGRAGQTSCTSVHKANLGSQLSIFDTGSSARARPRPNGPPERVHPGALKRPARTTETKRQGRAGQTSCTSVHKANLGSQLSIFDTGSSARARPRPNDPPERVQPGALKRPARTTETKRQGRAGQTSCTSVHKANLGSQLSIFDTGSSARARPRPNGPPERVHPGALKRPARTTHPNDPPERVDTGALKRPARTTHPNDPPERVHTGALKRPARTTHPNDPPERVHTGALKRPTRTTCPNDPPERVHTGALKRPTRTTCPNEFTRVPSNDPPERTTETNRQGRAGQTSCTNVHKANLGSQLSIFDTALARTTRPNEFTRAPSNDPPERPTRTSSHGRPQTTRPNDPPERPARTSSHGRPQTTRPNDFSWAPERPKRTDKGEPGKRAARTCTKPTSGHNLAFLIRPSPERVHPGALKRPARTTHPNEFTRAPSNDPPERPTRTTRPNDPPERPARTTHPNEFTRAPSNDPPERPTRTTRPNEFTRAPSNDPPERPTRTTCPNEFTRVPSNDPPERTTETNRQGRAGQTSCTNVHKANLGSQLSIFDTALARTTRPNEFTRAPSNDPPERPTRTTRPNEFTRAPSNDPPERPARTSSHGRPQTTARTSSHGHPQTTRPNEFTRAPSNDPPERPTRTTRPNEFTRAPSNDPPERPARTSSHGRPQTTRPNEFTRAPSNDPPERVHTGALKRPARTTHPNDPPERVHTGALKRPARTTSHGRPQTTRPIEFTREPSNDPPERPTRTTRPHEFTRAPSNDPPERPTRTTRPNEFTRAPSNDPPKRFFMGARTTETNRQGRAGQTSSTNVHKANLGSQLSIFDTALARTTRLNEFTRAPSNDPPERPTRTTRPIEFTRAPSNDPPERPTRTSSRGRPQTTRPNDFAWAHERPKRTDKGESGKRAARTCTKPTSGHNLAFFIRAVSPGRALARTSSHGCPQTTRPNDFAWAPERPKRTDKGEPGKRAARTCTKPTSGHNLAFFIRPSPERVHTGILKRPARTSSHGRPQTTRPNGFAWAPERPKRTDKGEPGKRLARTSLYTANDPARTSSHGLRHTTKTKSQGRFGQTGGTIFARGPPPFTT